MAAETITDAISDIRKMDDLNKLDEARTKAWIIDRLLENLGWNLKSPREFVPEYSVGEGKADYALNPNSSTAVFIEAKKPSVKDLEKHQYQLLKYCFQQAVNLGVLTNGRIWWLYLPRYEGPQGEGLKWGEKRFSVIDIANGTPKALQTQFEKFLAKENVSSGEAIKSAKAIIDEKLEGEKAEKGMVDAWNNLVSEPHDDLIALLNESTFQGCGVKPGKPKVKKFLQNHRALFRASYVSAPQSEPPMLGKGGGQNGKPSSFAFNGTPHEVSTWKQVLVDLCTLIYADPDRQDSFDQIMKIKGIKNPYFSRNPYDLNGPQLIGNSGIYAATYALNAGTVKDRCQKVLQAFRYSEDCFRVE